MARIRDSALARSNLLKALEGNLDPKARVGQKITQDSYFQQAPITKSQMDKVFGTEDEFLERYGRFQKDYEAAISNKLNHAKGAKVNVELMKRQGKTDLSVLNRETADKLYKSYMNDVMRMGDLLKEVGLPAYDTPNANLYKDLFQFSVDNEQGIVHPAQILLNRMSVNFDPNKRGLDSLNIGSGQQMSHRSLSNLFHSSKGRSPEKIFGQTPTQGQTLKIATIDIETTGVDIFSDTRSMTIAESILDDTGQISKPTTLQDFNVSFQSNKLSGVNVTTFDTKTQNQAVTSLTEHLANIEVGTTAKPMGEGGSTYLDEVERFFNKLLEADRVAGHNLNFDIDHMISTAMKQDGFGSHLGAQKAIDQFTQRAMDDKEYFVDTLESTRAYIKNQAEQATNLGSELAGSKLRSDAYVKNLFAQETLSKVHIGGSASYGSVTNLALNTNLFELIEKDGQAEELFGLIQKGSHVAETDVHLQTYIGNYVQSGRLKIRAIADHESIGKTAQEIADEALGKTDFGNFGRSKIAQSSAVNATTNIANVQHMSETVFKHVRDTPKGLQEVSLSLSREQINQMSGLGLVGDQAEQGTLAYHKATSKTVEGFYFATSPTDKQLVDQTESQKIITRILDDARNDTDFALGGSRNLPNITVGSLTGPRNRALESILDTGISYGRASGIDELARISTAIQPTHGMRQAASVAGRNSATIQDVTDTLGTTYRELGSGLSQSDQMRVARGRAPVQSVFQQGLNNYDLGKAEQIAKAFSDIGDPYAGVMDMNDRVYSTIMSSATSSTAHAANRAGPAVGYLAEDISHSAKPNLISELGMTFFKSQRDTKVINAIATDTVNKVRLPPEIAREALRMMNPDDTIKNVGISIFKDSKAGGADKVNAVWLVEKQMEEAESKQLSRNILEIMQDRARVISLMGGDEAKVDASVLAAVSDVQAAAKVGPMGPTGVPQIDEAQVENLNRSIRDRGIVVAHADETASAEIISNIRQLGIPTDNDVFLNTRTAAEQRTGHTADNFVVGPYFDREAADAAGLSGQVKEAEELVDLGNGRKISKSVHNANQLTEMIEADPSSATKIGKNIRRGKSGLEVNKVAEFYASHKVKMGYGALGLGIAATGYYAYKKGREKQLYEETLQQQPTERNITTDDMRVSSRLSSQVSSVRKDPLVTAGVVGNLDRAKIGHTQMGPNKYNHLFGG